MKTSNAYARKSDPSLAAFADNIIEKMTNNPNFTTPLVPLATLSTENTAYKASITAAANGDRLAISVKNDNRETMINLLAQQSAYVQGIAAGDLTVLLSSGFDAASTNRAQVPLDAPEILSVENPASTKLAMRLKRVDTAKAYEVRISYGNSGWVSIGVFTQARRILLEDLIPGTLYNLQARCIGGSTGASDWSDPISHMAT
ncbi:MAG: hypothetical protein ACTHKU_06270 [Verrucomicrobiota bacterium]